jgi:GDPmannose 4,6-dehydratase
MVKENNKPISLVTGINGQDGSFLAELLLKKGHEVHGIIRRASTFNTSRLDNIYKDPHIPDNHLHLHYGDITDSLSVDNIVYNTKPDFLWHLAAQSHVKVSFELPAYTAQVDAFGTLNMLEAMRKHCPEARFYNASSSELFGKALEVPQKETTPFNPQSPYGIAKLYAYFITKNYRESYNMFCVNGILFNHESERRGSTFVTAKIVNGLFQYIVDRTPFYLGNVYAKRDWGYAKEFVEAIYLILQHDEPTDFVIGTGETHTIKEFINECLRIMQTKHLISNNFIWKKNNEDKDILWDIEKNKLVIGIDPVYYRAAEVDLLLADASKAKKELGWEPKIKFKELVEFMMLYRINVGKI